MKRLSGSAVLGLAAVVALTGVGCESGGASARLRIELAGPSGGACESTVAMERSPCTTVQLFRRGATGTLTPVRLHRVDAMEGDRGAVRLRFDSPAILFDAELTEADGRLADLEIRVFGDDSAPIAGAYLEDVVFDGTEELRVRLYPFGEWSCPGTHEDGEVQPRALHDAVRLDNGDVLIFGGVAGRDVDPASVLDGARAGAALQRAVELYDATAHRFRRLTATDHEGVAGFGRVLFDSVYLGSEMGSSGPVHRIRVIGGFDLPSTAAGASLLRFDNRGTLGGPLGAPFSPVTADGAGQARPGRTVDLIYDPETGSVVVEEAEPAAVVPRGAFVSISPFLGEGGLDNQAVVLIGMGPVGSTWVPSETYYTLRRDGTADPSRTLAHRRLGASVDPVPSADAFLVWGGNTGAPVDPLGPGAFAGEILSADGTVANAISADGAPLPPPTAFHSSTVLDDGLLLIAGGFLVGADGTASFTPPTSPLTLLEVTSRTTVVARPLSAAGWTSTMYHQAAMVEGFGVVLSGGAAVVAENRLTPQDQVGVIRAFEYTPLAPLTIARFGHTMTPLSGRRILVVGGFTQDLDSATVNALEALTISEILNYDERPLALQVGECTSDQLEEIEAGVVPEIDGGLPPIVDAGLAPPSDAGSDAGSDAAVDAGPDAAVATDGG